MGKMFIYTTAQEFTHYLITGLLIFPLLILLSFFSITTFYLYYSLKNIFKIFFLTEVLLLIIVIFLIQLATLYPQTLALNYFYCQLILAAAAAEGALFLGLFSHLYDQQFTNRVKQITSSKNFHKYNFNKI
jgi:NADH:ubiquinone oxidoreductase subunit K